MMTKRERFLAFVNFEPVDRIPRRAEFYIDALRQKVVDQMGAEPAALWEMDTGHGAGLTPPPDFQWPDYRSYHAEFLNDPTFSIDHNGCGHFQRGEYHFTEYVSPLRHATRFEELENYPLVSNAGWSDTALRQAVVDAHAAGDFAAVWVGHMYEDAWQIRGYEPFLVDLLTQREWAEYLLDHFYENNLRTAVAAARAGYDQILIGDDVANQNAMMFHPDLWREVMKSRWAKVIAAARAIKPDLQVWYHSDGNITSILGDLMEIGVTILNPVQPECMNPVEVRRQCGRGLAFDGCVGTQTTFPFGTPDQMRQRVRELVCDLDGMNGGLMLSPTHVLEPEVPVENIVAFFEACDETSKAGK